MPKLRMGDLPVAEKPHTHQPRKRMAFTEHCRVADLSGRRHGKVRRVESDERVAVEWFDGSRQTVDQERLLLRFTSQSGGYGRRF